MNEVIHVGGFAIELRRSPKRRTLGLTVDRSGDLVAYAPVGTDLAEVMDWIETRLLWIHGKLLSKDALRLAQREPEFVTGEALYFLGQSASVRLVSKSNQDLDFDGTSFLLNVAAPNPRQLFIDWITSRGKELIERRIQFYLRRTCRKPKSVTVMDLGHRWGNCGPKGDLRFDWRLFQLPMRLVDYVVAHEVAHLRVPNHGPEFWKVLGEIQPDWRDRKDELDQEAKHYLRFTQSIERFDLCTANGVIYKRKRSASRRA